MKTELREWMTESCNLEPDVDVTRQSGMVDRSVQAYEYVRSNADSLGHEHITGAHQILMTHDRPEIAGEYRDHHVRVDRHTPPGPARVRYELQELLETRTVDSQLDALRWHVEFEGIHPFADGNGRVGRIIYLYHCNTIGREPIMFRAEDRQGYYSLFRSRDGPRRSFSR